MCNGIEKLDKELDKEIKVYGLVMDLIYIGIGGYIIGRVDNIIVRDLIIKFFKIFGLSLVGIWRYYIVLELLLKIKDR